MSKMCPCTCVGSVTNWSKPSRLYNWTKRHVSGSLGLSMWKLKSPTTSTFSAGTLSSERNMPTSSRKSQVVSLFPADCGGRYTQPSRIVCLPLVMHTSIFSNELKERCLHNHTLRCCRKMRATPPPLPNTRGLWRKENPGGSRHLTNADIIPLLPKPSLGETQYIQVSLHNRIVHLQGLVDSRPGIPHTHDDVHCVKASSCWKLFWYTLVCLVEWAVGFLFVSVVGRCAPLSRCTWTTPSRTTLCRMSWCWPWPPCPRSVFCS